MVRAMKRLLLLCLALSLMLLCVPGCAAGGLKRYSAEFLGLFDTYTQIVGYASSKAEFTANAEEIYSRLTVYHQLYDIYNDYDGLNNLKTINDNAGIQPVTVDEKIIDLLLYAKEMHTLTGGKCNVAMGAVLRLWHDYRKAGLNDPDSATLPPQDALAEAAAHADIDKVIIDAQKATVYLEDPLMRLDVGAIAKGYATEMVAKAMAEQGVDHFLLSVGGNIRAIGGKPADDKGTQPWKVGIRDPFDDEKRDLVTLWVDGISVVTSGDYERYYWVDGQKYHHIIHPETLMPAGYFRSVTVVCAHSGLADALSTALFNMPYEEGRAFVDALAGAEALWVTPDQKVHYTDGLEALLASKYFK